MISLALRLAAMLNWCTCLLSRGEKIIKKYDELIQLKTSFFKIKRYKKQPKGSFLPLLRNKIFFFIPLKSHRNREISHHPPVWHFCYMLMEWRFSPPRLFTPLNGPDSNFCHQFLTGVSWGDWHNERRQKRERIINQTSWISSCHLVQEKNDERRQCYTITGFKSTLFLKYTIHPST